MIESKESDGKNLAQTWAMKMNHFSKRLSQSAKRCCPAAPPRFGCKGGELVHPQDGDDDLDAVEIKADGITIGPDIRAGEIVDAEIEVFGKSTGVCLAARVLINDGQMARFSLTDLPPAKLEQNKAAAEKLLPILYAARNEPQTP